jgi:phosphotriesterase-related protein
MTLAGWGRDVAKLAALSRAGVHVIAASGYYVSLPAGCFHVRPRRARGGAAQGATEGADGTTIPPGLLKASVSRPVIEGEERCARRASGAVPGSPLPPIPRAGSASVQAGMPAGAAHLSVGSIDPARVIIGHCDENADLRQLSELVRRGAYVQFDVIGKSHWLLDETRADLIIALLERGHGDRLMISSDRNRVSELTVTGGPGYGHVLGSFVPRLVGRGVDDATLKRILVENPHLQHRQGVRWARSQGVYRHIASTRRPSRGDRFDPEPAWPRKQGLGSCAALMRDALAACGCDEGGDRRCRRRVSASGRIDRGRKATAC